MIRSSRKHLADAGESYLEHLRFAVTVAALMIGAGLACLIHALVPALCQRTCSTTLEQVRSLLIDRNRLPEVRRHCSGVLTFTGLVALCSTLALALVLIGSFRPIVVVIALLVLLYPVAYLAADRQLEGMP